MDNSGGYADNHQVPRNSAYQFRGQHIISDQITRDGLAIVWRELERALQQAIPGDIVEFGCYVGTTSLFIRRLLDERKQSTARHSMCTIRLPAYRPKPNQIKARPALPFKPALCA